MSRISDRDRRMAERLKGQPMRGWSGPYKRPKAKARRTDHLARCVDDEGQLCCTCELAEDR